MTQRARLRAGHIILLLMALVGVVLVVFVDDGLAADIFLTVTTVEAWIFVLAYHFRSSWRLFAEARAVMGFALSFALLGSQIILTLWWGDDYPLRMDVRQILYLGLALGLMNMLLTLWRVQKGNNSEESR